MSKVVTLLDIKNGVKNILIMISRQAEILIKYYYLNSSTAFY